MKKLLTYAVVLTTVVWSVGLFAMPLSVSAASAGDLIKLQCATGASVTDPCKAVYYLGSNNKRYVFPTEKTYKSWYSDFSGVKIVSATEMASYLIGGNVTYRPGIKMVKVTTDPRVYAVAANGTLREIGSEAIAKALYGDNWNTMVQDLPDAFWTNYTVGSSIAAASDYDKAAATSAATSISVDKNLDNTTPSTPAASSLTVSKAVDTPASGIAVENAGRVAFTKINLTAAADGDVTVDSWVIQRGGLGADGAFSSIDILDASTMLPINETGKTLSSDHTATVNDDFVIPAGTTKSIIIAANMASVLDSYAGQVPTLGLKSLTLKGSTTVVGTLPIDGNYQTINATITVGTATVTRGAYINATSTALEVGTTGYTFFSFKVAASSAEDVTLSNLKVYQSGTAGWTDLANIKLYQESTELATGVASGNYVTFTFNPVTIAKGNNKQFVVKADIAGGSDRTIILGIYRDTDLVVKGSVYGYNIIPTYSGTGTQSSNPVLKDNSFTISKGTLAITRSTTVGAGNIGVASDQVLGAFEFEAKGEAIDVSQLVLTITTSAAAITCDASESLTSVKLVDPAGKVVAGPSQRSSAGTTITYSDTFTVPIGKTVYKVVGTIPSSCGWATNDTVYATIAANAVTARGVVTGQLLSSVPASAATATTQTIKAAKLQVTKNSLPAAGNIALGTQKVLVGSWTFDARDSGEDVRITSIAIAATSTADTITLYDGSNALNSANIAPTQDATKRGGVGCGTTTIALTTPLVITKGTYKTLDLKANIPTSAVSGHQEKFGITSDAAIIVYGVSTGNSFTADVTENDGPLFTITGSGSLTISQGSGSYPTSLVLANTSKEVNRFSIRATNEAIDVTELAVCVADGATANGSEAGESDDVASVEIYKSTDMTTPLISGNVTAGKTCQIYTLDIGKLTVPKDGSVEIVYKATFANVGINSVPGVGTEAADFTIGIGGQNGIKGMGQSSGVATDASTESLTVATSSIYKLHVAYPTVAYHDLPSSSLTSGGVISDFTITAPATGQIAIYQLAFWVVTSSDADLDVNGAYVRVSDGVNNPTVSGASDGTKVDAAGAEKFSFTLLNPDSTSQTKYAYRIAAGETKRFQLIAGTAAGTDATVGGKVQVKLAGDGATSTTEANVGVVNVASNYTAFDRGSFVWSDLWSNDAYSAASANATGTAQWYNGYLVSGLSNCSSTFQTTNE